MWELRRAGTAATVSPLVEVATRAYVLSTRADNRWFVGEKFGEFTHSLTSVETVFVDARFAREDTFAGFNASF